MPTQDPASSVPTRAAPIEDAQGGGPSALGPTMPGDPRRVGEVQALTPGDMLGERYRVVERIGAGGMGEVFLGEHVTIGKPVAIKVLGAEFSHRNRLVERFMQEARAVSLIRHEHIVDITDFGHTADGVPYYVMEYLEGETLADRIRGAGRLEWASARDITLQMCAALQAAHDKGVIHRDMKPDNCFIVERAGNPSFVKVLDFGIAKIVTDGAAKDLTQTGMVMGTAAYMSPEQAQSLGLDARADVYSAAVILYEMLTGRVPFEGGGFLGILTKHLTERVPPPRRVAPEADITAAVEKIVLRALSKDRTRRFSSAAGFARALETLDDRGRLPGVAWRGWAAVGALAAVGVAWVAAGTPAPEQPVAGVDPPETVEPEAAPSPEPQPVASPDPAAESDTALEPEPVSVPAAVPDADPGPEPPAAARPSKRPPRKPTRRSRSRSKSRSGPAPEAIPERLSDAAIGRALARAQPGVSECKRHGALPGTRVKVSFTIEADGHVSTAGALPPNRGLPLGRCVAKEVEGVQFPPAQVSRDATRELEVR